MKMSKMLEISGVLVEAGRSDLAEEIVGAGEKRSISLRIQQIHYKVGKKEINIMV